MVLPWKRNKEKNERCEAWAPYASAMAEAGYPCFQLVTRLSYPYFTHCMAGQPCIDFEKLHSKIL